MTAEKIKTNVANVYKAIKDNSQEGQDPSLLCVTKYTSVENMQFLYDAGERFFGENKVQDAEDKQRQLPYPDIHWHLIGHLQRNKAKKAVQLFDCIQSIDSIRLLEKVNDEAGKINKKQDIFIQVNLTGEEQKYGFDKSEFYEHLETFYQFQNCTIKGIMAMGPHTDNQDDISRVFQATHACYQDLQKHSQSPLDLSMGMSSDFELAVKNGATMVRIGSLLTQ